ncbi:MAG TPA: DNA-formamidopyrimidine glycosylase family protein [Acidimicrobiales bacterium]
MPELVEVERYRTLAEGALERRVASVDSPDPWFIKGATSGPLLDSALVGRRFTGARRIGKLLLLDVDDGPVVGVRFGMTGSLLVDGDDPVGRLLYSATRHDPVWERWSVTFADGGRLVVHDPRRLGGVTLDPDVSHLGPDAASLGVAGLGRALAGSTAPLKARLLDQSRVAGIGNLIADEVLWRAGLSPLRPAASLTPTEVRRLHRHLARTLADLTERGGSHLGDLMDERHPGSMCPKDGYPLVRTTVGGRTTWWCPAHQV